MKRKTRQIQIGARTFTWAVSRHNPRWVLVSIWEARRLKMRVRLRNDDIWLNYGPILALSHRNPEEAAEVFALEPVAPGLVRALVEARFGPDAAGPEREGQDFEWLPLDAGGALFRVPDAREAGRDLYLPDTVAVAGRALIVSGRPFIDYVREAELPLATAEGKPSLVGACGWPDARLPTSAEENGYATLLDCDCGCVGCWPLQARVGVRGPDIFWFEFRQTHRAWVYELGPFRFRRAELEAATGAGSAS